MAQNQQETYIPRIYGAIERARLLEKLELAVEHKLTLICAPPGYGKTTTAAQFAQRTPHPVVWHTVEERERDFPTFYAQSIAAFSQVLPNIQHLANSPHFEPSELAANLTNFLRTTLRDELFYVLDDVHHLIGSAPSDNWLQTFVSLIPAKCHVILISRTLPTLALTEMIARREVLAIGQEELRFTDGEIETLTGDFNASEQPNEQIHELIQRLEGWPAGIILALQPFPLELERLLLSGGEGPEALFNSLASMMLAVQPPGLRNFLLASSTLSRLTPELAAHVLGLTNASEWIAEALRRNLFLSRIPSGLTYHKLFRSFLQRQFEQLNPGYFFELHLRAGHWFEKQDRIDEAFEHYLTAGAPELASALINHVLRAYFAQGKMETLLKWADNLDAVGISDPKLLYAVATIQLDRLNYEAASTALDQAEALFAEQGDPVDLAEIQLLRARMNLQNGHYLAAIAAAEKQLNLPFDDTNLHGRALRVIGLAHLRLGRADLAAHFLEDALPLSRASADKLALSNLLQDLIWSTCVWDRLKKPALACKKSLRCAVRLAAEVCSRRHSIISVITTISMVTISRR